MRNYAHTCNDLPVSDSTDGVSQQKHGAPKNCNKSQWQFVTPSNGFGRNAHSGGTGCRGVTECRLCASGQTNTSHRGSRTARGHHCWGYSRCQMQLRMSSIAQRMNDLDDCTARLVCKNPGSKIELRNVYIIWRLCIHNI